MNLSLANSIKLRASVIERHDMTRARTAKIAGLFASALVCALLVGSAFAQPLLAAIEPKQTAVVSQSSCSRTATTNYAIQTDGTYYYAFDSDRCTLAYGGPGNAGGAKGTDFGLVLNDTWNALISSNGGLISMAAGTYIISTTSPKIPTTGHQLVYIIDGAGDGGGLTNEGTLIKVEAPGQILAPGPQGASAWPRFYIQDLAIINSGTYSASVTDTAAVDFTDCLVSLTNVAMTANTNLQATDSQVRMNFAFRGSGAPGEGVTWRNVYFGFQPTGVTGYQGEVWGLFVQYEGFHWDGGGISLNYGFSETTRTDVMSVSSGAGQAIELSNLDLFTTASSTANKLHAFLDTGGANLINVELPSQTTMFVYDFYPVSSGVATVTVSWVRGGEGTDLSPGSITYPGPPTAYVKVIGYSRVSSGQSVTLGVNNSYGVAKMFDAYLSQSPQLSTIIGGIFGSETISINVTAFSILGTKASFTQSFTTKGTYTLNSTGWATLLNVGIMKEIDITAKTTARSTSVMVSVTLIT